MRVLKGGRPEINLVPIDPVHIDEAGIVQSKDSPVNIQIIFKDVLFYGLSDLNVTKVM